MAARRPVAHRYYQTVERSTYCILLMLDREGRAARPIRKALRKASDHSRVLCAFTPAQAASHLIRSTVDAVLIDLRFWDRLGPQSRRNLLAQADHRPIVVLLDEDDVVDVARATEIGASGCYYKDQLDASFVRRLDQLVGTFARRSLTTAAVASPRYSNAHRDRRIDQTSRPSD